MIKATRYICEICGKPYTTSEDAGTCELHCRDKKKKEEAEQERRIKMEQELNRLKNIVRNEVSSTQDMISTIVKYAKEIFDFDLNISFSRISFKVDQDNMHHCPIGGVTNWERKNGILKGYPGYLIHFSGEVENNKNFAVSDLFNRSFPCDELFDAQFSGFHLYCGGGDSGDLIAFIDDFPKMKAKYEEILKLRNSVESLNEIKVNDSIATSCLYKAAKKEDSEYQRLKLEQEELSRKLEEAEKKLSARDQELCTAVKSKYESEHPVPDNLVSDEKRFVELRRDLSIEGQI